MARALLGDVKALLLDEPTAALGSEETDRLRDIVEVCDRIVVLREGRVVMEG